MKEKEKFDAFIDEKMEHYRELEALFPKFIELAKKKRNDLSGGKFRIYDSGDEGESFGLFHPNGAWWITIPVHALMDGEYYYLRYVKQY